MADQWTGDEVAAIGAAEELEITSRGPGGELRKLIPIWVVRVGDGLYVRSAYGPESGWYRRAVESGSGYARAGGVEGDVRFEHVDAADAVHADLDAEYHRKYDRFGEKIVGTVVGPEVRGVTLRLERAGDQTDAG